MRSTCVILVLLAASCGGPFGEREAGLKSVPTSTCASGQQWAGGNDGSDLMHPGSDCNACHAASREGPIFQVAGTVYADTSAAEDCAGVSGATVTITDANNQVFTLTTNEAGNFYLTSRNGSVAFPYKAKVSKGGQDLPMSGSQSNGACNSCHSPGGSSGAPGRVMSP